MATHGRGRKFEPCITHQFSITYQRVMHRRVRLQTDPLPASERRLSRLTAGIGLEVGRFDSGDGASFIPVGGVARYADGADNVAGGIANEDAARDRDHSSLAHCRQGGEEHGVLGGTIGRTRLPKPMPSAPQALPAAISSRRMPDLS